MAIKNQPAGLPEDAGAELLDIGELRRRHKTSWAIFAGMCSANNWKPGKTVSEEEYLAAVKTFLNTPMNER